jgi:hypothetical protein
MAKEDVESRSGNEQLPAREVSYKAADGGTDETDVAEALDDLRGKKREHHIPFFTDAAGVTWDETGLT